MLDAAARFRLLKKAARLRQAIDSHGQDDALFQEVAAALGYKENKLPFMLLGQRLPLRTLRDRGPDSEAMLFGFAGFLEERDLGVYGNSTRAYVRRLWDRWWPQRDEMQRLVLPAKLWRISGTRPVNHPQRRLAALAVVAAHWPALRRAFNKQSAKAMGDFFEALDHPFWTAHYTLTAEPASKRMALVGESRISEILANVFYPLWIAEKAEVWVEYSGLPSRLTNRRIETAAARLFGNDPRRAAFMKTLVQQQGLLQIYEDFCLQDNSDCAQCPFPEQMAKWTRVE